VCRRDAIFPASSTLISSLRRRPALAILPLSCELGGCVSVLGKFWLERRSPRRHRVVEVLEERRLLSGIGPADTAVDLGTIYSLAEANFQSWT
jgi:hypothetical protein